jgi:3-hydroxybutyryl-CoA dehydrogenase
MAVYIVGESPMVEEMANVCSRRGYAVTVQWNSMEKRIVKGLRRSNSIPAGTSVAIELTNTNPETKRSNVERLDRSLKPPRVILSSSVTVPVGQQSSWTRHPSRIVGISALPTLISKGLVEFAPSVHTSREALSSAQDFFMRLGKEISVVQDRIGMVMPRILCMLINEAYFALQEGIALPADIDNAMKLGTSYPLGPVEWGEQLGFRQVYAVLSALQNDLAEDRYRIAPLLKQMTRS